MKKHLLLILLMMLPLAVSAAIEIDGIFYNLNAENQTAEVTFCYQKQYSGDITIPASITYQGVEYSVTNIGGSAFHNCMDVTSVTIPNSVKSIGESAFWGCSFMTTVTIGTGLESIGYNAFDECGHLTKVVLNSNALVSRNYSQIDGLRKYFGRQVKDFVLGDAITSIGTYAFAGLSYINSISISNSVKSIGEYAFFGCGITTINIPNSVETINRSAFDDCDRATSIVIGAGTKEIKRFAFGEMDALKDVYCYAEQVPNSYDGFMWTEFWEATLHVPAASLEAYRNAEQWKDFGSIVALTDGDPKPTAIDAMEYAPMATNKAIYDLQGHQLAQPKKGLNIIRMSDGKTKKVIVK